MKNKKEIKFVVFSNKTYESHSHNVLKECLNAWSSDFKNFSNKRNLLINWIYSDINRTSKLFFVTTTEEWLKTHQLDDIISNELFDPEYYVSYDIISSVFQSFSDLQNR